MINDVVYCTILVCNGVIKACSTHGRLIGTYTHHPCTAYHFMYISLHPHALISLWKSFLWQLCDFFVFLYSQILYFFGSQAAPKRCMTAPKMQRVGRDCKSVFISVNITCTKILTLMFHLHSFCIFSFNR